MVLINSEKVKSSVVGADIGLVDLPHSASSAFTSTCEFRNLSRIAVTPDLAFESEHRSSGAPEDARVSFRSRRSERAPRNCIGAVGGYLS
jgi:hypothetical protein